MTTDDQARKTLLLRYLNDARAAVLWKAEGLDEASLRRPLVPSGSNLLGIVQHLAVMEYGYLSECLARPVNDPQAEPLIAGAEDMADFIVPASVNAAQVIALYRRAIAASEQACAELPLHAPAHVPWWGSTGIDTNLERMLIHMGDETSRHAGHMDILRELLDGRIGYQDGNDNLPAWDAEAWAAHREGIQRDADKV